MDRSQHLTCFFSRVHYAEHFAPLFEQIAKLDEALYNIQFEQHWLEAQTDRQAICMSPVLPLCETSLSTVLVCVCVCVTTNNTVLIYHVRVTSA
jgi:hypothetical protein